MQDKSDREHPELFEKLSKVLEEDEGSYLHLSYHLGFQSRSGNLLIWVYQGDQLLTRFERFGIHALGLHRQGLPTSELYPEHRRFAQHLLRFANLNPSEGYFNVPRKQVAFFLSKLGRFRQVLFHDTGHGVKFADHFLIPTVELHRKDPTQVHLHAGFKDSETGETFSFQEVRIFTGRRSWAFRDETCYPIKPSTVTPLLEDFDEAGFLTLKGVEAADFIQEYLPTLAKKPEVILPEGFSLPEVRQVRPEVFYKLREETGGEKLFLDVHFSYGGYELPPYRDEKDVLVEISQDTGSLLIRRDLEFEKEVLDKFSEQGFQRTGLSLFETGGDSALDFLSETLPKMKENFRIQGEEDLEDFRLFGELGVSQIRARATGTGIDWLDLDLTFEIGGAQIPYEIVQSLVSQGKRYLKLPGKGFLKIQTEDLQQWEDKLSELDVEMGVDGKLKARAFHAAYLDETLQIDWSQSAKLGEMVNALRQVEGIPRKDLPENLKTILREYQHHGFDWMHFLHEHRFHGILADDMGLGKTVQALTYLQDWRSRWGSRPNLVLAPTSVVFNWVNEAKKFTPELKSLLLVGPKRKELFGKIEESDLILTSYALFRRDVKELTRFSWRTVILDEAQNIKNYRSKTALLVKELKAEQRWALTGTPLENRLSELWSIFDFLMPNFLGNYPHFKRKYQQPIEVEQSSIHLERLRKRIFPFVLRRLKSEVAQELPPKTEVTNYCEMTSEQAKIYQDMLEACRRQVFQEVEKRGIDRSQVSILTALLRLRQICCHPELLGPSFQKKGSLSGKMEAFKDLVTEVISEGHRVLVFSQFVEMLGLIRSWLEEEKIVYEYLDGRTKRREDRIRRFNEDASIPLFLVSLRAGGTGLNLTGADYVVHYDPWWNPAVQDQATDRVHRIGQTKHVFSYKLITRDSVEEKILLLQERKRGLVKGLLSADSAIGKKLTHEDLEYLFS
jgi:hypothetical protein